MNTDYLFIHDELDDQLAQANSAQLAYDDFKAALIGDCLARGVSVPVSYALSNAWIAYQRKKKAERAKQRQIDMMQVQINKLQERLAELKGEQYTPQNLDEPDFDAIHADSIRIQKAKEDNQNSAERRLQALRDADEPNQGEL